MPSSILGDTVEYVVRRNDTMDRIFRQLKLNLSDLATLRDLPDVRASLDRLREGDTITLVHDEGLVQSLTRRISETAILSVTRANEGFNAEVIATPLDIQQVQAEGTIDSSLFVAARAAGVSPELILQMANDIFGWDIDFALDIQPGDKFNLVYEQKYRDGKFIGNGRILAADFVNNGTLHRAVWFESKDGKVSDYFRPDGRSVRRAFLRAPLEFTRISSNFNPARRHPILNTIRAHKGVDYAAATGTVDQSRGRWPRAVRRHERWLWSRRDPRARRRRLDALRPHVPLRGHSQRSARSPGLDHRLSSAAPAPRPARICTTNISSTACTRIRARCCCRKPGRSRCVSRRVPDHVRPAVRQARSRRRRHGHDRRARSVSFDTRSRLLWTRSRNMARV